MLMSTSSCLATMTVLGICLNLCASYVLPAGSGDSPLLLKTLHPTNDDSEGSGQRSNSRQIRSVFSVPVKPSTDCPEGTRRVVETGECVAVAPEIKSGGDKFLIDSLKNFYRITTTQKPPRRRRTTTTTTTPTPGKNSTKALVGLLVSCLESQLDSSPLSIFSLKNAIRRSVVQSFVSLIIDGEGGRIRGRGSP